MDFGGSLSCSSEEPELLGSSISFSAPTTLVLSGHLAMQWNFWNVSPVRGLACLGTLEIAQGDGFSHQLLPQELIARVVG